MKHQEFSDEQIQDALHPYTYEKERIKVELRGVADLLAETIFSGKPRTVKTSFGITYYLYPNGEAKAVRGGIW